MVEAVNEQSATPSSSLLTTLPISAPPADGSDQPDAGQSALQRLIASIQRHTSVNIEEPENAIQVKQVDGSFAALPFKNVVLPLDQITALTTSGALPANATAIEPGTNFQIPLPDPALPPGTPLLLLTPDVQLP